MIIRRMMSYQFLIIIVYVYCTLIFGKYRYKARMTLLHVLIIFLNI